MENLMEIKNRKREANATHLLYHHLKKSRHYLAILQLIYTRILDSTDKEPLIFALEKLNQKIAELLEDRIEIQTLNEDLCQIVSNMPKLLKLISEDETELLIPEVRALHLDLLNRYLIKIDPPQF